VSQIYAAYIFGDLRTLPDKAVLELQRALICEAPGDKANEQAIASYEMAIKACLDAKIPMYSDKVLTIIERQAGLLEKMGDYERASVSLGRNLAMLDSRFLPPEVLLAETPEMRTKRWKRQFTTAVRIAEMVSNALYPPPEAATLSDWIWMVSRGAMPQFWDKPPLVVARPDWITAHEASLALETAGNLMIKLKSADEELPPSMLVARNPAATMIIPDGYGRGMLMLQAALTLGDKYDSKAICRSATIRNNIADAIYRNALLKRDAEMLRSTDPVKNEEPAKPEAAVPTMTGALSSLNDQPTLSSQSTLPSQPTASPLPATGPSPAPNLGRLMTVPSAKQLQQPAPTDYKTDIAIALRWADNAKKLAAAKPKDPACNTCLRAAIYNRAILLEEQGWFGTARDEFKESIKLSKASGDWDTVERASKALDALEKKMKRQKSERANGGSVEGVGSVDGG